MWTQYYFLQQLSYSRNHDKNSNFQQLSFSWDKVGAYALIVFWNCGESGYFKCARRLTSVCCGFILASSRPGMRNTWVKAFCIFWLYHKKLILRVSEKDIVILESDKKFNVSFDCHVRNLDSKYQVLWKDNTAYIEILSVKTLVYVLIKTEIKSMNDSPRLSLFLSLLLIKKKFTRN